MAGGSLTRVAAKAMGSVKERMLARTVSRAVKTASLALYLRGGFRKIEGWCGGPYTFLVLDVLAAAQPQDCRRLGAAEIGVHHGLFFIGMHNLCEPGGKSLALDLFELQDLNVDASGYGDKDVFARNLRSYAAHADDCIVHDGIDSLAISAEYAMELRRRFGPFRFVSVDGGHTPEHCSNDLRIAEQITAQGGVVVLDDSFSYEWPGVTEGMYRYLGQSDTGLVPFAVTRKKAFLTQPEFADRYKRALEAELGTRVGRFWTKDTQILGREVSVLAFQ